MAVGVHPPVAGLLPSAASAAVAASATVPDPVGPAVWVDRCAFEHTAAVPHLFPAPVDALAVAAELAPDCLPPAAVAGGGGAAAGGGGGGGGGGDAAAVAAAAAAAAAAPQLPAVSFDAWVAAAGGVARLDSSAHAGLVVEGLATVAPASWAAVNGRRWRPSGSGGGGGGSGFGGGGVAPPAAPPGAAGADAAAAAPPRAADGDVDADGVRARDVIPLAELLAFVALASAPLAGGAGSYRATANAVWPEDTLPVLPGVAGGAAVAGGPAAAAAVAAGGTAAGVVGPGAPGMAPSAGADGAADALLPVPAVTPAAPASPSVSAAVVAGMGGAGGVAGGGAAAAAAAPGGGLSPAGTPTALTPASPVPSSPGGSASSACRRSRAAAEARRAVADAMGQSHARQLLGVAAALGRMLQGVAAAYGVAPVAGAGGGAAATPAPAASPGGSSGTLHVKGTETAAALVAVAAEGTPRAWEATPLRREQVERLGWLLLTSFSGRCLSDVVTGWDAGGGGVPLGEVVRQLAAALARPSMAASAAGPLAGLVLGPSASTGAGATAAASSGVPASGVVDGSRLITISGLEKRTLMRRHPPPQEGGPVVGGAPAPLPDVRVVDCTDAHVYILFPVRRLTMLSCSAVTLFAAAASSTAVLACSDVSVHAATGRVSLANSLDARLYLHVCSRPVLVGDVRGVAFGPYNSVYPRGELVAAAAAAGVDLTAVNRWNDYYAPVGVAGGGGGSGSGGGGNSSAGGGGGDGGGAGRTLAVGKVAPFAVPLGGGGGGGSPTDGGGAPPPPMAAGDAKATLLSVAVPLPPPYAADLEARYRVFEEMRRNLRAGGVGAAVAAPAAAAPAGGAAPGGAPGGAAAPAASPAAVPSPPPAAPSPPPASAATTNGSAAAGGGATAATVQSVVNGHFREWLIASNNIRQLQELVALTPEGQ